MFKKLVVGTLATGIVLTGGIGAASASTEGVDNTKQNISINGQIVEYWNSEYNFWYEHDKNRDVYKTYKFKSPTGKFMSYFESGGIKWYFKGVAERFPDGSANGHYEGRR